MPTWTARSPARRSSSPVSATIPTPCTDVDVRALVNHLVTGNLHFAALVNGTAPPDGDADHLGDDPQGAFRRAAAAVREALARPGVLSSEYALPFGTIQGVGLVLAPAVEVPDGAPAIDRLAGFLGRRV